MKTAEVAISLDLDTQVVVWIEDSPDRLKPSMVPKMQNTTFKGWYSCGLVTLKMAIANWKWHEEHLGDTDGHSIYKISPIWIFPVGFEVPQDWLKSQPVE
jgi:hypothetical protein